MKRTLITDIAKAIRAGATKQQVLVVIQAYIDESIPDIEGQIKPTAVEWARANAELLRKWAYPSLDDFVMALIKLHSGYPQIESEGQTEMSNLIARYIAVRNTFTED